MDKQYHLRISFGDGKPVDDVVIAKNGLIAQDIAFQRHPGARTIHLLCRVDATTAIDDDKEDELVPQTTPHPLFTDDDESTPTQEEQILQCVHLRKQGKTHKLIANSLGVSTTTVGRWLKQYG